MSLYQLCKLPVLIEHFQEHRQRDQNISLLDFFSMHYWGKHIDDGDEERDNQLPFKEFHKISVEQWSSPIKQLALKGPSYFYKTSFPITADSFLPDPGLSSLFRPPRA